VPAECLCKKLLETVNGPTYGATNAPCMWTRASKWMMITPPSEHPRTPAKDYRKDPAWSLEEARLNCTVVLYHPQKNTVSTVVKEDEKQVGE